MATMQGLTQEEVATVYMTRASTYKVFLDEVIKTAEPELYATLDKKAKILWAAVKEHRIMKKNQDNTYKNNCVCISCGLNFYSSTKRNYCTVDCEVSVTAFHTPGCDGCRENAMNQEGHMYPGGCLYIDPSDSPELPPLPPSPSYMRMSPINMSLSYNLDQLTI